ncbi:hypothetical protein MNBD_GAMMA24-743 [hydrothermal vent metagenome]|uniref:Uncharacterized protein n=1 Tax=hydrothermal vent metagenome TaxID=652676 RepID=A0A3B1B5B9_9ZZZZ
MNEKIDVPLASEDAAWASINTPLDVENLRSFCQDIERLFRINPMLEFKKWQPLGNNRYFFSGLNISQEIPFEFEFELQVKEQADGLRIEYSQGLKASTTVKIEAAEQGSKLTIIDYYDGLSEEERKARIGEVDKSLITWAHYLQKFILTWRRWSRIGPWRWYMHRIWQPMKPTARRITYMLLWITAVEIVLIMLGAGIYWAEYT